MRIVLAVDGSPCADEAVKFVTQRRWSPGDTFLVLSIVEPLPREYSFLQNEDSRHTAFDEQIENRVRGIADSYSNRLRQSLPENPVSNMVATGPAAPTIVNCARDWSADLIIVGSHGRKGMSKLLLGSVAEDVMRLAPCSVQIVRQCVNGN
jgi:nucleotide-binding universal stress UspA family protein